MLIFQNYIFLRRSDPNMDPEREVTLYITGMTCKSCTDNIERTVGARPGIIRVTVDLAAARGRFRYDPSVVAPDIILEHVEDMGFGASFTQPEKHLTKTQVEVKGMTCQSCVSNIDARRRHFFLWFILSLFFIHPYFHRR